MAKSKIDTPELARKRAEEVEMVAQMIALWCRGHHHGGATHGGNPRAAAPDVIVRLGHGDVVLCSDCAELLAYARARIEHCPHMGSKTFCSVCPTHCYKPEMRERIREVMRWSGPRMLRYRPLPALRHAFVTIQSKRIARHT